MLKESWKCHSPWFFKTELGILQLVFSYFSTKLLYSSLSLLSCLLLFHFIFLLIPSICSSCLCFFFYCLRWNLFFKTFLRINDFFNVLTRHIRKLLFKFMTAVLWELCWAYVPYENVWCCFGIQIAVANDWQLLWPVWEWTWDGLSVLLLMTWWEVTICLTHCGLVFFPLYLSQIINSK
jgi:hypothetical protein